MHDEHAPPGSAPDAIVALGPQARVRDRTSGNVRTFDDWIAERMAAEQRTQDECREQLLNAIARGDVTIEDSGDTDVA